MPESGPGGIQVLPAPPTLARIISGGQSGVDRAALDVARKLGLPYGGWCPFGGWADDFPDPPGVRSVYPELRETASTNPAVRTHLNVRDSHATVILSSSSAGSPGTDLTRCAARALGRPCLESPESVAEILTVLEGIGFGLTVNIAGPRESEYGGAYRHGVEFLRSLIELDRTRHQRLR